MASIFKKDDNYVEKPNRNTFDLSFQNNLSLKFGKLIPCMCQEVLPGDSFQINPTFGLRYLPQVFPVQTRMRAHLHFFYVRNRTIWKDWMDFIGKTKENLVVPYLQTDKFSSEMTLWDMQAESGLSESSIFDYMGLPVVVDSAVNPDYDLFTSRGDIIGGNLTSDGFAQNKRNFSYVQLSGTQVGLDQSWFINKLSGPSFSTAVYRRLAKPVIVRENSSIGGDIYATYKVNMVNASNINNSNIQIFLHCDVYERLNPNEFHEALVKLPFSNLQTAVVPTVKDVLGDSSTPTQVIVSKIKGYFVFNNADLESYLGLDKVYLSFEVKPSLNRNYPMSSLSANTLPYGNGSLQYRINALPFRAYEAIYNSFYRNAENNPFKVNGVPEYNRYVKTMDGGPQPFTDFKLFNRNWEDDAYTTAVPTPQQGNAPRVGLTGNPSEPLELRVYDQDGNISTVNLVADSDGYVQVAEGVSGDTNTLVNALNDAVNYGITINDLRNVNSLQLWLEKNVRKGYKYPDQIMSHFGIKVDYDDLMIPEFIGGVSRDVTVNQISQTVETATGNLGDMAGQAYVVGEGKSVRHYCPEHGYIIGIVSVVPVPNYSQLIPKHFFKHDTFDYFFPEFGKIGMQPITNKEIAATASWLSRKGDETFGYQRAWYDYLANVDQVHGKFNSDFYNFLLQRKFDEVPELGESFTTVINEDLNNIFYTDSDEDKILGQIYFDIKAIRPIPLYGIPSLE